MNTMYREDLKNSPSEQLREPFLSTGWDNESGATPTMSDIQLTEIPGYKSFVSIKLLEKGWSNDLKYIVTTKDGSKLLIRVSDAAKQDNKEIEFENMQVLSAIGIPMQHPISFGMCNSGKSVYILLTWLEGENLDENLLSQSQEEQYELGVYAGELLKQIHTIPAPVSQRTWEDFFNRKTDKRIVAYHRCKHEALTSGGEELFLSYVEHNRHLLKGRPSCFQHGDYHPGNMIISKEGKLSIIDWNRHDFGDPWEEFCRLVFTAHTSPGFATGQLHGYFDGEPPLEFFKLLAFYIASNALGVTEWAKPFGKSEIDFSQRQNAEVLTWYNNMQEVVPSWYKNEARVHTHRKHRHNINHATEVQ